jgi:hypothetical protein
MQQRRMITQQARHQMESVCMNSSLSQQQKRAEIRQIHERERQELEGVISPAQREALRVCQEQRGHVGIGHGGRGHGVGPCGELSARPHPFAEDEEDEAPPKDERKPN